MARQPKPQSQKRFNAGNHNSAREAAQAVEAVARATEAFRQGKVVAVVSGEGVVVALATETASDAALAALSKGGQMRLVLTHARAQTLKIRIYTPDVVALGIVKGTKAQRLSTIADPTDDLSSPLKGPFDVVREALPAGFAPAVKLAKLAGLLPSVVARTGKSVPRGALRIAATDIANYDAHVAEALCVVTRARVPLKGAERTELVAFRPPSAGPEHYAIVIGNPPNDAPVLARLHSECFTGDLLGSLKCDCGEQLRGAIEAISKAGGGVLLYLAQEGRGIGLINKLRAYRLQDQGFDTVEANERLGFEADERVYAIAARMFKLLGFKSVRLMTNNPDKVKSLRAAGVKVAERVPHKFPDNDHNRAYLKTKAEKTGHLF